MEYTFGLSVQNDPYHISTVRSPLTRNLAAKFDDLKDEIIEAFTDYIPPTKGKSMSS